MTIKRYLKEIPAVGSGIMIAAVCLVLGVFMTGCGNKGAGDVGAANRLQLLDRRRLREMIR